MFPIASYTGGGFGFLNIPQNFQHLQLRISSRTSAAFAGAEDFYFLRANQDFGGGSYTWGAMTGSQANGTSGEFNAGTNYAKFGYVPGGGGTANVFGQLVVTIFDYTDTSKFKQIISYGGHSQLSTSGGFQKTGIHVASWDSLSAITRLDGGTGTQVDNSATTVTLYGLDRSYTTGA